MCIYIYIYVYVYIYIYIYSIILSYHALCICIYIYIHVCMYIYIYIHMYVCIRIYIYIYICISLSLYIYTHIHIQTGIMYISLFVVRPWSDAGAHRAGSAGVTERFLRSRVPSTSCAGIRRRVPKPSAPSGPFAVFERAVASTQAFPQLMTSCHEGRPHSSSYKLILIPSNPHLELIELSQWVQPMQPNRGLLKLWPWYRDFRFVTDVPAAMQSARWTNGITTWCVL